MNRGFCSLLFVAGVASLACDTGTTSSASSAQKGKKSAASATATSSASPRTDGSAGPAEGTGPDLNAHPSGKTGSGGDGSRAAVGDIKESQIGANPNSGDETSDNVSKLMSSMGGDQSAPAVKTALNLTTASAAELFQGDWKSGRSAEQDELLKALEMGLEGDPDKVEASSLEGDSKEVALKLAVQVALDKQQGSASPIVSEATSLVGELTDPMQITMRVDSARINVDGDFSADQKGGGKWSAEYSVTGATGNTATVSASRESGTETVTIVFVENDQIWVPRPGGSQGTIYFRSR